MERYMNRLKNIFIKSINCVGRVDKVKNFSTATMSFFIKKC